MTTIRNLSIGFAAGSVGALANVLFLTLAGLAGLIAAMQIQLPPPEQPAFLYRQVAWGGLWGLLLALPILSKSWIIRGVVLGVLASLATLFIFFPLHTVSEQGPGMAGLNLGALTPLLVLIANTVWGLVAAKWYDLVAGGQSTARVVEST